MENSPHNTVAEQTPTPPPPAAPRDIMGVSTSHLSDDQHDALTTLIQTIVNLVLGLVFRKRG